MEKCKEMREYKVRVVASRISKVLAPNDKQAEALVDATINDHYKDIPGYFSSIEIKTIKQGG